MRDQAFAIGLSLLLGSASANGASGDELAKASPSDGATHDIFGISVAADCSLALIGAYRSGNESGSAYLFDFADPTNPVQRSKLRASDAAAIDNFGYSVAIGGGRAVIGSLRDSDNGSESGSAYLFDISDPSNPIQASKLLPNDGAPIDRFGVSVALHGGIAVVSADQDDDQGIDSGSVYVFDISVPSNPVQLSKLVAADGSAGDHFGRSVAISGSVVAVGAEQDDDNGSDSGSVYLFDISDPVNPLQVSKIGPSDGSSNDYFGWSIAMSNDVLLISSPGDDDSGNGSGSAYLFDVSDASAPSQESKLLASDGGPNDEFGTSVAIGAGIAVIGAYRDADNGAASGSAYMFDITNVASPLQLSKLLASDGASNDDFGYAVGLDGITAIVGASGDDDNGVDSGSAYFYEIDSAPCPGDVTGDGTTDLNDLSTVLFHFGESGSTGDTNCDDVVDLTDLSAVLFFFGTVC
ncbi:MAG: FG-GAP repeat protein [Phycisphaerales bacterium]|nr:FG-GAP repeat protein [Phycisphaerales bacterium]